MKLTLLFFLTSAFFLSGCSILHLSGNRPFEDGVYTQHHHGEKKPVYIQVEEEEVKVYATQNEQKPIAVDTTGPIHTFNPIMHSGRKQGYAFSKNSFDIDFLTTPLKFRPSIKGQPARLNASLNGALYFGYRTDSYLMKYLKNPLHRYTREINHLGFSFGGFIGLGSTLVSPTNTLNQLDAEYDGVILSKGLAGIFAVNNFTVGLTAGFDNLLDHNHRLWLFQNKPWIGLSFGLNLN